MEHPFHARGHRPPFDSPLHRLDARTKLLCALALVIVVVSTPPRTLPAFAGYAAMLAGGLAIGRVPIGYLRVRLLVVLPFVAAVAVVPFLGPGDVEVCGLRLSGAGLLALWNVAVKAALAVGAMTLLVGSTHFADLLRAMNRLKAPGPLVALAAMTHRYLFVLLEEAARMRRARDARGYGGRWIWQAGVIGRLVGTLFLRSYERGERVHAAMLARGFDGTSIVASHAMRFRFADWAVLAGWTAVLAAARMDWAWATR